MVSVGPGRRFASGSSGVGQRGRSVPRLVEGSAGDGSERRRVASVDRHAPGRRGRCGRAGPHGLAELPGARELVRRQGARRRRASPATPRGGLVFGAGGRRGVEERRGSAGGQG
ncbi:hypothetical protein ACIRN5_23485 [Lysinibacillus fusiformis]|uniref:hypothetical protein n=1 Tax=Lysinibacillus fusiformis TaxID=28031 RepID=UPI0037F5F426